MNKIIVLVLALILGAPLALAHADADGSAGSAAVAASSSGSAGSGSSSAGSGSAVSSGSGSGSAATPAEPAAQAAPAAVPSIDENPVGFFGAAYRAATSKQWLLLTGCVLMALVWVLRLGLVQKWKWFGTTAGGITLAFAISAGSSIGAAATSGMPINASLLLSALTTAATAAGLWQWVSKQFPSLKLKA